MKLKTRGKVQIYGVWLHNKTDRRDDEWKAVKASSEKEALEIVDFDSWRFSLGRALPKKKFCDYYDLPPSFVTLKNS